MNHITLTLTGQELQVLQQALAQMPYGVVAPLIGSISAQIQLAFDTRKDEESPNGGTQQSKE